MLPLWTQWRQTLVKRQRSTGLQAQRFTNPKVHKSEGSQVRRCTTLTLTVAPPFGPSCAPSDLWCVFLFLDLCLLWLMNLRNCAPSDKQTFLKLAFLHYQTYEPLELWTYGLLDSHHPTQPNPNPSLSIYPLNPSFLESLKSIWLFIF